MGTSTSGKELANKLQKAARASGKANRQAVSAAALVYKEATLASAATDTGGDLRMSHWGWSPVKGNYRAPRLGAYYDVKGFENATALLRPKPIGLWVYLEGGAKPHPIKVRTRGRNRRKALALAGGGFAAAVNHPGTRGKKTWSRGLKAGEQPALRAFKLAHQRSLLESFR
jgi:hypothetical protein